MKARVRTAATAGIALTLGLAAGGSAGAAAPVIEKGASAAVLASAGDDGEALTARASVQGRAGLLFENQWEIGAGAMVAAERDDPRRDPRGGRVGDCAPALAGCPSVDGQPVRGYVSGSVAAGPAADEGARLSLERAFLYVRSGWGEATAGRDEGVGQRFSLTPPTILAIGGGLDPLVDGTGRGGVILRNDISGQSAKLTVSSTRILGLQAGISWTPELEHEGLDQGYRERAGAPLVYAPEDILEGGLSFAHTFAGGWETAAGLTYAQARDGSGRAAFGDMQAVSAGVTVTRGAWSGGLSWLGNDNGWAAGGRDYAAWGASGVYRAGDWSFLLEAGQAQDDLTEVDVQTLTVAGRRALNARVALAGGATYRDTASPEADIVSRRERNQRGFGAFLELSFSL